MQYLKLSTGVKVVIGPVVAVGDGFTPVTTLSLSTADEAELIKHDAGGGVDISGNTFGVLSTTAVDGYYNLTLTAGQLDTVGMLTVAINDDSLCLPVRHDFMVLAANAYDAMFAGTGVGIRADVRGWLGTTPTTPPVAGEPTVNTKTITASAITATAIASNAITVAKVADGAITAPKISALNGTQWTNLGSAATNYSATRGLTGTALPAVAAAASGGVPVIGTTANTFKSDASANVTFANTSIATATAVTTVNGLAAGVITAASIATDAIQAAKIQASALNGKGDWNIGKTGYTVSTVSDKTGYSLTATTGLGNQTADITGNLSGSVGSLTGHTNQTGDTYALANGATGFTAIDTVVDTINTNVGTNGNALSAIPWNAAWDAEVESEVNDALDSVISELGVAQPTATPTIRTALMLLYMTLRNRLDVDAGTATKEVFNDAGTLITSKALTDNGTVYSEAKMS